jgi:hypothetical protein
MTIGLIAAAVALTTGALALIVFCWRSRTVLGGALGAAALGLLAIAFTAKPTGGAREAWLAGAAIALLVGVLLYVLGHFVGRLLDADPEADPCRDRGSPAAAAGGSGASTAIPARAIAGAPHATRSSLRVTQRRSEQTGRNDDFQIADVRTEQLIAKLDSNRSEAQRAQRH